MYTSGSYRVVVKGYRTSLIPILSDLMSDETESDEVNLALIEYTLNDHMTITKKIDLLMTLAF